MAHDAGTQAAGAAESQPPVDQASTGSAEPASARDLPPIEVPEASLRTIRVVDAGMVLWALALVVILAVPSLREGDRDWWVWIPVAALGLGVIGHAYLARGRGNAADA